uniref:Uncharacterized protein n=1 Tax=Arundo donax TaxID=35708 RepID=A0A0A9GHZ3_ARUDO
MLYILYYCEVSIFFSPKYSIQSVPREQLKTVFRYLTPFFPSFFNYRIEGFTPEDVVNATTIKCSNSHYHNNSII